MGGGDEKSSLVSTSKSLFRPIIASSLALTLGVNVGNASTTCSTSSSPYACYKYDSNTVDPSGVSTSGTGWKSFNPSSGTSNDKFTSNNNFEGQYLPKNGDKFLGVGINGASLILQAIDTTKVSNDNLSGMDSKNPMMFGDFYTTASGNSKTSVTFENSGSGAGTRTGATSSTGFIFDGGIQTLNGSFEMEVKSGDINIQSASFGSYGLLAQNNGKNTLKITGTTTAQTVTISDLTSKTDNATSSLTKNSIVFTNTQDGNKLIIGNISTTSATTEITSYKAVDSTSVAIKSNGTMDKVDLNVGGAIVTNVNANAEKFTYGNIKTTISLNGNTSIGENTLKTMTSSNTTLGITTRAGVANITLTSSANASGANPNQKYESNKNSLTTPRIYATNSGDKAGKNIIKTEGDITLSYIKGIDGANTAVRGGIIGGDILAANGGVNEVTLNGVFKAEGWEKKSSTKDGGVNQKINSSSNGDGTTIDKNTMLISTYGGSNSKNIITVKNTNGTAANGSGDQNISLGTISAYGGTNQISLYGSNSGSNKKVEIASLIASNVDQNGNQDAGGTNEIFIKNGNASFDSIITREGGSNTIAITGQQSSTPLYGKAKIFRIWCRWGE